MREAETPVWFYINAIVPKTPPTYSALSWVSPVRPLEYNG